jgi:inorganic pyrophosphatase
MEISKEIEGNPIVHDTKNGKLRYTAWEYPCNYGAFPQTWEDPQKLVRDLGIAGDGDPLDVCEISGTPIPRGCVIPVRVLGVLALIDEGECDWKVLALRQDIPVAHPSTDAMKKIRDWFAEYKIPDGKQANTYAYDGAILPVGEALGVVKETHLQWMEAFSILKM